MVGYGGTSVPPFLFAGLRAHWQKLLPDWTGLVSSETYELRVTS